MTDQEQKEREAVLRERKAFVAGAVQHRSGGDCVGEVSCGGCAELASDFAEKAKRRYPLPKVTRPRVVTTVDGCWRFANGRIQWKSAMFPDDRDWEDADASWTLTGPRIRLFVDLVANPTETVDAE
jgi:hypothetical protein